LRGSITVRLLVLPALVLFFALVAFRPVAFFRAGFLAAAAGFAYGHMTDSRPARRRPYAFADRHRAISSPDRRFDWTRGVTHPTFEVPMAETSTAVIASANNLSVKYGTQVVLDGATIAFTEGEHIGLVGRNGSGKSTFLSIAAGVAQADAGEFTRRRDLVTGYMPQVSGLDDAATVHANILSGAQRILDLIAEYERVPGDSPLSATLLDQIGEADGWNLEHRSSRSSRICTRRNPIASWHAFRRGKTPRRALPGASRAS
jgi:hypothetical protein